MIDLMTLNHYNAWANKKLLEQVGNTYYREGIPRLLSHIINAHHIWNHRILEQPEIYGVWYQHEFSGLTFLNASNHQQTLVILEAHRPEKSISYTNSKGEVYDSTIADLVFHMVNHSTHHRAQVMTELRNFGVIPLALDYIFYQRK